MATPELGRRVGCVVITYSPGDSLEEFLSSLRLASANDIPVIISDNGSTDGSPQAAVKKFPARLVVNETNPGYGAAANVGAGILGDSVDWILVCNPDLTLDPGAVDALIEVAANDDQIGAVGPEIVDSAGSRYPSARELPSLRTGIGHALFVRTWPENPWTRRYRQEDHFLSVKEPTPTGWLSGACLLVRRSVFEQIGGFDEEFFMYFEDVDICRRIGQLGLKNVYVPASRVHHVGAATTSRFPQKMLTAHHRSAYTYLAKKHSSPILAPVRLGLRLALWSRLQISLLRAGRQH